MKANRYPGNCTYCGGHVARNAGKLVGKRGRRWTIAHLACAEGDAPAVTTIEIGDDTYIQNSRGRCLDAPCCGCCNI